jgi:UDP-glucose 6-dehydrogenase
LALKVTFCNEFFDVAGAYGIDYNELREVWLEDPRIGRSHTFVYEDKRGYGGKCLPKDVSALIESASERGVNVELMQAVQAKNKLLHRRADDI